jgi:glycosyltransferase involved in cell wall biosynthesis
VPRGRQIQDREATIPQGDRRIDEQACVVGAAMRQEVGYAREEELVGHAVGPQLQIRQMFCRAVGKLRLLRGAPRSVRVCIVTHAGYVHGIGGMQRHTSELSRGLSEAGHSVDVITTRHPDGIQHAEHEGALWHFVDSSGNHVDRGWHRESYRAFFELHRQRRFDVVHSEASSALGLVRKGLHCQVPLVVKYHGNFLGLAKANARRALRDRTPLAVARELRSFVWLLGQHFPRGNWWRFHDVESMVASHQQLDDTRRSHMIPRSRIHVVPNGVDVERFAPRNRDELREALGLSQAPLVVSAGRLNREKGVHTAIRAVSSLSPPAQLVIVGDGPERERLEALVRTLRAEDRVEFTGPRSPADVARFLAAADVFVFPTERDEGAPMIVIEAMAAGLPVVATSIAQIAEVVDRPGENGVLVPPADVGATAGAVAALLEDPERARQIGAAARQRVLAEYTLERMVERTVEVYELAIRKHRASERA